MISGWLCHIDLNISIQCPVQKGRMNFHLVNVAIQYGTNCKNKSQSIAPSHRCIDFVTVDTKRLVSLVQQVVP
jgi:hypothetical protein